MFLMILSEGLRTEMNKQTASEEIEKERTIYKNNHRSHERSSDKKLIDACSCFGIALDTTSNIYDIINNHINNGGYANITCLKGFFERDLIEASQYAILVDKSLIGMGKPMMYGTQIIYDYFAFEINGTLDVVNIRRKAIGLKPLGNNILLPAEEKERREASLAREQGKRQLDGMYYVCVLFFGFLSLVAAIDITGFVRKGREYEPFPITKGFIGFIRDYGCMIKEFFELVTNIMSFFWKLLSGMINWLRPKPKVKEKIKL